MYCKQFNEIESSVKSRPAINLDMLCMLRFRRWLAADRTPIGFNWT
jgi:hypothetical protein